MKKVVISKKPFKCAFCGKKKTGAYRIVDDAKSCESCNRAYDYRPGTYCAVCPVCKGQGYLQATFEK